MANSVDELKALANTKLGFARPNRFLVTLPSFGGGGLFGIFTDGASPRELNILCSQASLPAKSILTTERRIGMEQQKMAYGYQIDDVSLTFYMMNDYGVKEYFDTWKNIVINENSMESYYKNDYARTITIHQLRQPLMGFTKQLGPIRFSGGIGGGTVYSIDLLEAFPINTSEIQLNNELDGLVQMNVVFAYTNWRRSSNNKGFINMDVDTPFGGIDII